MPSSRTYNSSASRAMRWDALGERWLDDSLYDVRWVRAQRTHRMRGRRRRSSTRQRRASRVSRKPRGVDAYDTFLNQLESLCVDYSLRAMERLGWKPPVGEVVQADALAERLRVVPAHRRLFARLLAIPRRSGLAHAGCCQGKLDCTANLVRRGCQRIGRKPPSAIVPRAPTPSWK